MTHSEQKKEKPSTTLPGTVQKIIKIPNPKAPEQAEIVVENAEEHQLNFLSSAAVNEPGYH